jgi:hypothetical protein
MQDGCIERYPALYGSDDRIHACMSELGVPLTRHPGFHQCDLWGDVLGLLGAHPVAPLVSLHHFDFLQPVFPTVRSRTQALRRLFAGPVALVTEYERHRVPPAPCRWRIPDPAAVLDRIIVLKKPDPDLWKRVRTRVLHVSVLVLIADIHGNVAS